MVKFIIGSVKSDLVLVRIGDILKFDFNSFNFGDNKVIQTILNHIDVTIHKKNESNVDLYVRRSFSKHLWDWLKDSASLV